MISAPHGQGTRLFLKMCCWAMTMKQTTSHSRCWAEDSLHTTTELQQRNGVFYAVVADML
jgi:hypothetical protein